MEIKTSEELEKEAERVIKEKIPPEYIELKSEFLNDRKKGLYEIAKFLIKKYHIKTVAGEKRDEIFIYENGVYAKKGRDVIRYETDKILEDNCNEHYVNEIIGSISRKTFIDRNDLGVKNKNLICLNNGILNIETKELLKYSPDYCFLGKIPVWFNPKAKYAKIQEFLNNIFYDEDIDTIQEMIGYLLLRDYRFKKAMLLLGEKDSGKTKFLNLIVSLIGKNNISGESLQRIAFDRFASASLYGKYLNLYDDLDFRDISNNGAFKMLTGNSLISAEYKFRDRFSFYNFAKLIFSANKIPNTKDVDDDAYYERWLVIRCDANFSGNNRDPDILEKITTEEELSGLLNWSLIGLERLLVNGEFSYKMKIEEIKMIMMSSGSSIASFVQDELVQKDDGCITKEELFKAYSEYTHRKGFSRVTINKLGIDLPKFAGWAQDGWLGKKKAWRNVSLKNEEETKQEKITLSY